MKLLNKSVSRVSSYCQADHQILETNQLTNFLICFFLLLIISSCGKKFELSANQLDGIAVSYLSGMYKIQEEYFTKNHCYSSLENLGDTGVIDSDWANGAKASHSYEVFLDQGRLKYEIYATPIKRDDLGSFVLTSDGQIRGGKKQGKKASLDDPIVLNTTSS